MNPHDITKMMNGLDNASKIMPMANILSFADKLVEAHERHLNAAEEIAKIESETQVLMAEIRQRYGLLNEVFGLIFEERKAVLDRHCETIRLGIERDDENLILAGTRGLGELVAASPFQDIEMVRAALEGRGEVIEI